MSRSRVAVLQIVSKQLTVTAAAAEFGISRRHLHRLLVRYREGGLEADTTRQHRTVRAFRRATQAARLAHARPYDLRHSFASLLLHERRSVIYVARQLGHDARLTLTRYGHVMDELEDAPRIGAEVGIADARRRAAGRPGRRVRIWFVTKAELHKLIDELPNDAVDGAAVLLRGIIKGPIDPDQAWFWTPEWQAGEREADADIAAARGTRYNSDEEFLDALDERSGSSGAGV
jgi:hypothetical protein